MPNKDAKQRFRLPSKPLTAAQTVQAVFGFSSDITELKSSLQALRRSEARYRSLFDLTGVGTLMVHVAHRAIITEASKGTCHMLDVGADDLIGRHFCECVVPEDKDGVRKGLADFLASGAERYASEFRCSRRDGSAMWSRVTVTMCGEDLSG
jgi:PAS domain S-box-containing protein